jgi:hypothetical protein
LIFESLFPNELSDPTSKRLLTDRRTALLASEGMTSGLEGDSVLLISLTLDAGETENTEEDFGVNSLLLSLSVISDHSGLSEMDICLGSISTAGKKGDAVFQESWLYMLADDIAVDITAMSAVKTALIN